MEESYEELSSDQGIENNENHWNPNRGELISILSSISEDQIAWASIEGGNGKHTNEYEHASQNISKVELDKMLQVKDETTPGTLAVWVTRDSHESIGHGVKVFNQILKARDEAFEEASNDYN